MKNNVIRGAAALLAVAAWTILPARADLSLDTTFDTDGIAALDITTDLDGAADIAVQGDGKYVTVGVSRQSGINYLLVTRFNANGTPDTGFGTAGTGAVTLLPGGTPNTGGGAVGLAVVIQGNDQKIVIGGAWNAGGVGATNQALLLRLNPNGSLDDAADADPGVVFGNGGSVIFNQAPLQTGYVDGIAIQPDGKIVGVGSGPGAAGGLAMMLRVDSNGTLDTGFNDDGVHFLQGASLRLAAVEVLADGKILAAGGPGDLVATRVNSDGTPDLTFGTQSVVQLNFFVDFYNNQDGTWETPPSAEDARGIAVQPDGKILLAGVLARQVGTSFTDSDPLIVRLNADGSKDNTFGSGGLALLPEQSSDPSIGPLERGTDIVLRPSGDMVLIGENYPPMQVSADGTGFAPLATSLSGRLQGLAPVSGGTMIAVGDQQVVDASNTQVLLVRLNATDLPDPAEDTVPDPFVFVDAVDQERGTLIVSEPITITGIDAPTTVQVIEGEYSINCAPGGYTATQGTVNNNETICVRRQSSATFNSAEDVILVVGRYIQSWIVTTGLPDTEPDAFTFQTQTGVAPSTLITSNAGTISGINTPIQVRSISQGSEYSIGCTGTFTSSVAESPQNELLLGSTICVRHTSSATASASVVTSLVLGPLVSAPQNTGQRTVTFTSVVAGPDAVPDDFQFVNQTGVQPNTTITSAPVTITGLATGAAVTVSGGTYSVGCVPGNYTSQPGTISNGQTICVRHQSASAGETSVSTTLTVGGVSAIFTSTTRIADLTPGQFTFTDQTDVPLSVFIQSSVVLISGIDAPSLATITNGQFSINCSGTFRTEPIAVDNNTQICVRHVSGEVGLETVKSVLTVGGVSDEFATTTIDVDAVPEDFAFTPKLDVDLSATVTSDPVTITGIDTAVPVFVVNGTYSLGCNGTFVNNGSITDGQTLCVRHQAGNESLEEVGTEIRIGGKTAVFISRTLDADQTPDVFSFVDQTGVQQSSIVTSEPATITGITAPTPISIVRGEYSIGCDNSTWTSAAGGLISNGQTLCVRHVASFEKSTSIETVVTVGPISASFTSTTTDGKPLPGVSAFDWVSLLLLSPLLLRRRGIS